VPPQTAPPQASGGPAGPATDRRRDLRWAALVATLVALPLTAVLVLVVGRAADRSDPAPSSAARPPAGALPPVAVPAPPALSAVAQRACAQLLVALPSRLGDRPARPVDSPSPYVAAWGEPAVTLRCGVARPPTFLATATVQEINGVTWFAERRGATTAWTVVDRLVYVEVLAPADDASAPVARLSASVDRALTARLPDPVR